MTFAPTKFYETILKGEPRLDDLIRYLQRTGAVLGAIDATEEAIALGGCAQDLTQIYEQLKLYVPVFTALEGMATQSHTLDDLNNALIVLRANAAAARAPIKNPTPFTIVGVDMASGPDRTAVIDAEGNIIDLARSGRVCCYAPNPHRKSECSDPATCCNPE